MSTRRTIILGLAAYYTGSTIWDERRNIVHRAVGQIIAQTFK